MTKKSKTVKEDDLKTKLIEEGELSHEAIENLITIRNGIDRHYAFAESAIPTDVFKPNISKIEGNGDAYQYFQDSIDEYEKLEIDKDFYVLWDWFRWNFKNYDLSNWNCDEGEHHFCIDYVYAEKFLELPYEHVLGSFNLNDEKSHIWNPLVAFFSFFEDSFYRVGMVGLTVDWRGMEKYYKEHKRIQNFIREL